MVDWDLAVTTAKRLMRPSPDIPRAEAAKVVSDLRRFAAVAEGHVRAYTLLETESATAPVVIVDRPGWVQANVDGLRVIIDPLVEKLRSSRPESGSFATSVGSRVTGLEAGGLFAFLSNKVLGQFDPFFTGLDVEAGRRTAHGGRLLLVAPNIVQVERELGVDPDDFRLWVCLHEETHRVQFTAVPWLRAHLLGEMETLLDKTDLDPGRLAKMMREAIEQVGRLVRGDRDVSLLDIVQTPEQRVVIERLTAVMSLLEGHADVVMDGVGPGVVTSVDEIRTLFNQRRAGAGALDQMIRKLLGFDAKLRQYRDGAAFVKGVLEKVGMAGFNAVWAEPANLPTKDEIAEPARWVTRVHG
jgi:coenzyme F420 biosynthesis associated uncharacterized protein